jgi:ABC-type sugar transport system permease subunit
MYQSALEKNDWATASAMGILLSIVACLVLVIYYRITSGMRAGISGETR